MLTKKQITKFSDFRIEGSSNEFLVARLELNKHSEFFAKMFEQNADIGSYKIDIPVKDFAIEIVLKKLHGQEIEVNNDELIDVLHIILKWNIESLRLPIISRVMKILNSSNVLGIHDIAQECKCKELLTECEKITPDGCNGLQNSIEMYKMVKETKNILENKIKSIEDVMTKKFQDNEKQIATLSEKVENIQKMMVEFMNLVNPKGEEKKIIIKKKAEPSAKWKSSKIMTNEQEMMLKNWIKPNESTKIKLKLLYQGTKDGFNAIAFHSKCDKKGPTVSVIMSNYGKIFGGFTYENWESSNGVYANDPKAFTFSLSHKVKCALKDLSNQYTIYKHRSLLSTFGGGNDFYIANECTKLDSCYANGNNSYQTPTETDPKTFYAGAYKFSITEIEVYSVDFA